MPREQIGNHSIYDPKKSGGAVDGVGQTWSITYGDGSSAKGNVFFDTVSVGGAIAQNQAVEVATNVSKQFLQDFNNDGLLGLGFDSGNTSKSKGLLSSSDSLDI